MKFHLFQFIFQLTFCLSHFGSWNNFLGRIHSYPQRRYFSILTCRAKVERYLWVSFFEHCPFLRKVLSSSYQTLCDYANHWEIWRGVIIIWGTNFWFETWRFATFSPVELRSTLGRKASVVDIEHSQKRVLFQAGETKNEEASQAVQIHGQFRAVINLIFLKSCFLMHLQRCQLLVDDRRSIKCLYIQKLQRLILMVGSHDMWWAPKVIFGLIRQWIAFARTNHHTCQHELGLDCVYFALIESSDQSNRLCRLHILISQPSRCLRAW